MKFLAIETSSARGSLALVSGGSSIAEVEFPEGLVHGREIAVRAEGLLGDVGWNVSDLGGVAVGLGPGSFTGLRVGVTAAKTLALARHIPVVGESSLAVVAAGWVEQSRPEQGLHDELVLTVLDGRRHTYFAGAFSSCPSGTTMSGAPPRVLADGLFQVASLLVSVAKAAAGRWRRIMVLGEGADAFLRDAADTPELAFGLELLRGDRELDLPRASALGRVSRARLASTRFDAEDAHRLEPAYLRLSDAELRRGPPEGTGVRRGEP